LRGWLFTIMHNQNANAIRRAVRGQANVDLVVQFKRMVPDNVSNRIAIERSGS
jgi:DNA-directed RNA polymerase specialized sigma24 family protein